MTNVLSQKIKVGQFLIKHLSTLFYVPGALPNLKGKTLKVEVTSASMFILWLEIMVEDDLYHILVV